MLKQSENLAAARSLIRAKDHITVFADDAARRLVQAVDYLADAIEAGPDKIAFPDKEPKPDKPPLPIAEMLADADRAERVCLYCDGMSFSVLVSHVRTLAAALEGKK